MKQADRISNLPPYLFTRIEKKLEEAKEKGIELISLGIGDPDLPTPAHIVKRLQETAENPDNHRYPTSQGMSEFRQAVASWYLRRHGVNLNLQTEVVTLMGSKDGIAHFPLCWINPGDVALVPDPGYPVYGIGTILAGGTPEFIPLRPEHGYLVDFSSIPAEVAKQAKLLYLNYPNNPTAAVANLDFFQQAVEFAKSYDLLVCHDAAYTEITFDGYRAPSFLEASGAKEVGIEVGSLSKPFNMTGWRIGWGVGNADVIEALTRLKTNLDSGVFQAVQEAATTALTSDLSDLESLRKIYQERRDILVNGLNSMGWKLSKPLGSFYVWAPVPSGYTSAEFVEEVLEKTGVVLTPGNGYGNRGEGYFRMSLTLATDKIGEAIRRIKAAFNHFRFD